MGLPMKTRQQLAMEVAKRYRGANRREKGKILDDFVTDTGYTRAYAGIVLRKCGLKLLYALDETVVEAEARVTKRHGGGRPRVYTDEVQQAVGKLWELFGYLCGKRLVPVIRAALPFLDTQQFVHVDESTKDALGSISPATVDRMLQPRRAAMRLKGTSYTRGTAALSDQIPIRTFGEWQGVVPGHVQLDLVGHDGGIPTGQCCFTLTATDVCTGWTERWALQNRAGIWVCEALDEIRADFPFPFIELHPDNGSEFININLLKYCKDNTLRISRSRAGQKNDNCYVEQKNFDVVRKLVGYARFVSPEAVTALNELYRTQALLQNYIYPSQKLIEKTRSGAKVKKRYGEPLTPAQRVLDHASISKKNQDRVKDTLAGINPVEVALQVARRQQEVARLAVRHCSAGRSATESTA